MRRLFAGLTILLGLAGPALAQTFTMPPPAGVSIMGVPIVANCGTPPSTYTAGAVGYLMMDTTGKFCTSASGGGGSSAVTIADGADVAEGAVADAASSAGGVGTVSAKLRLMTTQLGTLSTNLGTINTTLGTPAQAGATVAVQGSVNTTLTDCSSTIATGGTAQNAFTANASRRGFIIANIDTSEVMWINFTGTAAASGTGSYPLAPASATTFSGLNSFASPLGMGINTALSVIAATTSHKFSCTVW